jgi:hypothetical protein
VVGRKGKETRFELDGEEAAAVLRAASAERGADREGSGERDAVRAATRFTFPLRRSARVFITCRASEKILEQVKELVAFGQIVFRRNVGWVQPVKSAAVKG